MKRGTISLGLMCFLFIGLETLAGGISWFEKEKEIIDEYLTRLFTPRFTSLLQTNHRDRPGGDTGESLGAEPFES